MKNKIKEIADGWLHLLIKDSNVEQEAIKRLEQCADCPNRIKQLGIDVCSGCGCPLMAKVRSKDSECPLNRW